MSETVFLGGKVRLHGGDSRDVLKTIADSSIDSVVTDPPYALVSIVKRFGGANAAPAKHGKDGAYARASAGFMGKQWDTGETAFAETFWAEVLRVLKPGGHIVAFSGTRTYHRMACAIEDAGFEIREMICWTYGSGFPKSLNVTKGLDAKNLRCACCKDVPSLRCALVSDDTVSSDAEQDVFTSVQSDSDRSGSDGSESDANNPMRDMRKAPASSAIAVGEVEANILQRVMPGQDIRGADQAVCGKYEGEEEDRSAKNGGRQPGMEGRRDASAATGELRVGSLCAMAAGPCVHGEAGRLRDGASPCDGEVDRTAADADGMRSSCGSQPVEQSAGELGSMAGQPEPQAGGAWPLCDRCGKPVVPDGIGTALKPALEPICLARKPLSEGTVVANVLAHGTGGLNIGACRVEGEGGQHREGEASQDRRYTNDGSTNFAAKPGPRGGDPLGRFPANLLHDGSPEVLSSFPDAPGQQRAVTGAERAKRTLHAYGDFGETRHGMEPRLDSGSAARFFYSAKADADDRLGSKHPTVKPVDLMQWLVRLVTPKGGTCLDPFAGTGTTGEAAFREGMNAVLIEREEEYQADIARRMALCLAGPLERSIATIKAKAKPDGAADDDLLSGLAA